MKERWQKASFTLEAAIYIPIILFVLFYSLDIGIEFFQESKMRQTNRKLDALDVVEEFYTYQILAEAWEEITK